MNGLKQSVDDIKKEFPMIAECVVSSTVSKGNSAMSTTKISR